MAVTQKGSFSTLNIHMNFLHCFGVYNSHLNLCQTCKKHILFHQGIQCTNYKFYYWCATGSSEHLLITVFPALESLPIIKN